MKINKRLLVLTSLICLLPIVFGLLVWKQLPTQVPTHFGFSGEADGYSSKIEAVFILPLILLALHIFTIVFTAISPKSSNVGPKITKIIYWMLPLLALLVQVSTFLVALGYLKNPSQLIIGSISLLFIILGNYLPKLRQNYTVGIKLPWTLNDEKNWNRTHRMAGKVWVVCASLSLLTCLFPTLTPYIFLPSIALMILVPVIYSYQISKKEA
ncbi:DUF1648 domain-containing protein [Streptococcus gallolyticus]|uniref:SdpI family protein n=1 Tax=Streptococcus hepaticus TaxID=3349163 RepID=UPI001C98CD13|nr:DUF1648 domain-containing protein [Streptococcus gallolyticus]MBY5040567.1 DUF1648 domain-containing protein [Streptococcus gallolyticus]